MSNINCNKLIYFSLGYYKRCLQCAKNSHKSALPFNVENHYIVNKTEKALGKRLHGKPGFAEESPLYSPAAVAAKTPPQLLTLRRRLSTIDWLKGRVELLSRRGERFAKISAFLRGRAARE